MIASDRFSHKKRANFKGSLRLIRLGQAPGSSCYVLERSTCEKRLGPRSPSSKRFSISGPLASGCDTKICSWRLRQWLLDMEDRSRIAARCGPWVATEAQPHLMFQVTSLPWNVLGIFALFPEYGLEKWRLHHRTTKKLQRLKLLVFHFLVSGYPPNCKWCSYSSGQVMVCHGHVELPKAGKADMEHHGTP